MSKKTLLILLAVLAVLVGALWQSGRQSTRFGTPESAVAGPLLAGVDLITVRAIAIEDGSATTRLERVEGVWCVVERDRFPAEFDRLRAAMQAIDELGSGQLAEEGEAHLTDFGLSAEDDPAPLRITLEHEQGTTLLSLGKERAPREGDSPWGPPRGRYARVDRGPVVLLKEDLRQFQANPDFWWERQLLTVEPAAIQQVKVSSPDDEFSIERNPDGTFALSAAAEGEEVDAAAANRLFGALRDLRADRILAPGEEIENVFLEAHIFQAEAVGATYRISLGAGLADMPGGQPARIEVTTGSEATPEQQAATALAQRKLNNRTFLVPAYLAESLCMEKDALVRIPEPVPESSPEPDPENASELEEPPPLPEDEPTDP